MCVFMYDVISVTWSCRYRGLTGGRSGIRRESVGELHGTELYGTVHRERKGLHFHSSKFEISHDICFSQCPTRLLHIHYPVPFL